MSLWIWLLERYVCLWRYGTPFFVFFFVSFVVLYSLYYRWGCSRRYNQESSIVSFKIANLLQFYLMKMRRTVGDDALLSTTLKEYVFFTCFLYFYSINVPWSLTWHTSYSTNQLKIKVMPFLANLCSEAARRWHIFLIVSKQDHDDWSIKPPPFLIMRKSSAK